VTVPFEQVVTSRAEAIQAAAGADRLELCANLEVGGLTPDRAVVRDVLAAVRVPVHVMIRSRGGDDFGATAAELAILGAELAAAKALGAHGFVFGFLDPAGDVDVAATRALVEAARPRAVTFHRAFDRARDRRRALEQLVALGIERVLTSGGAPTAWQGRDALRALVAQAAGRIAVVAGGGVRAGHWRELVAATGVPELHGSQPLRAHPR
jgi:copper homeostasis protein